MSNKTDQIKFERVRHEWVHLRDLRVHPKVQRINLNENWVKEIADKFDPDSFGELSVVRITGQTYFYVFDGWHRMEAARSRFGDDQRVPCAIHEDMSIERQAKTFLELNERLAPKALDRWKNRILAKDDVVLRIEQVLHQRKLRTDTFRSSGAIVAVAALEKVFTKYGGEQTLSRTLDILINAWGSDPEAYDGLHLRGVGMLAHRFNGDLDDHDFARKLGRSGGPGGLLGKARDLASAAGISTERAICQKLLDVYNKNRTTKRLELK